MFVKTDKPEPFIGKEAVAAQKEQGAPRKLVGLELDDRAVPRHGYEVLDADGNPAGYVTTGYRGISVDKSIAAALVDSRLSSPGTRLWIKIRKKTFPATVVSKKFYRKNYRNQHSK